MTRLRCVLAGSPSYKKKKNISHAVQSTRHRWHFFLRRRARCTTCLPMVETAYGEASSHSVTYDMLLRSVCHSVLILCARAVRTPPPYLTDLVSSDARTSRKNTCISFGDTRAVALFADFDSLHALLSRVTPYRRGLPLRVCLTRTVWTGGGTRAATRAAYPVARLCLRIVPPLSMNDAHTYTSAVVPTHLWQRTACADRYAANVLRRGGDLPV